MGRDKSRASEVWFIVLFIAPLTIALAAPPILEGAVAQRECEQLVVGRLAGQVAEAKAEWVRLIIPHWSCQRDGMEVAQFGWWATSSSDTDAELIDDQG